MSSPVSILTVCTGNICRSPAAELLFARALGDAATVSSAGTHALVGHGIPVPMLHCLEVGGLDGRGHLARQFTASLASSTDLIVCMTTEHRGRCVREAPFALKKTFTLGELAAAAAGGAPLSGGVAGVAAAVADYRVSLAGASLVDVPDPYLEPQAVYDSCYSLLSSMVDGVAEWMLA